MRHQIDSTGQPRDDHPLRTGFWHLAPWIVTAGIFATILHRVPFNQAFGALRNMPILLLASLMMPLALLYLLLDSLCLRWVIGRFNAPIRLRDVVPIRASMYLPALVNNNLGFAGVSYYLHRRFGVRFLGGLSSVLFVAFIDVYVMFLFSGAGMRFFIPAESNLRVLMPTLRIVYVAAWAVLGALMIIGAVARRRKSVSTWIGHTRIGAFAGTFIRATPLDYAILIAVKAVGFACAIGVQYETLALCGISVPLDKLVALLPLVYMAAALPITVAQLGPAEGAWMVLFAADGAPDELFAYAIAVHLIFTAALALIGFSFLRRASRDLSRPNARTRPSISQPAEVSAAESVLPSDKLAARICWEKDGRAGCAPAGDHRRGDDIHTVSNRGGRMGLSRYPCTQGWRSTQLTRL
jgi:hypothetical protein